MLGDLHAARACLERLYRATDHQREAEKEFSAACELIEELVATVPDETLKDNFLQGAYSTFRTPP